MDTTSTPPTSSVPSRPMLHVISTETGVLSIKQVSRHHLSHFKGKGKGPSRADTVPGDPVAWIVCPSDPSQLLELSVLSTFELKITEIVDGKGGPSCSQVLPSTFLGVGSDGDVSAVSHWATSFIGSTGDPADSGSVLSPFRHLKGSKSHTVALGSAVAKAILQNEDSILPCEPVVTHEEPKLPPEEPSISPELSPQVAKRGESPSSHLQKSLRRLARKGFFGL